jgi:uncharacterized repeat protein (TIGR03803 family)
LVLNPADGYFYGTTSGQNGQNGNGTIFKFNPSGAVTPTTIYTFTGALDGGIPLTGLLLAKDGNFYGTASASGAHSNGTIFSISPPFDAGLALTPLYPFCSATNCTDGGTPLGTLVQGTDGNIYGTTSAGLPPGDSSTFTPGPDTSGTIFSFTPPSTPTAVALNVLYSFCSQANCTDGSVPKAGLVQGTDKNFYGTASSGGLGYGLIFEFTPAGTSPVTLTSTFFHGTTDGSSPAAALVQGTDGNFYGVASSGGSGSGTFFQFNPTRGVPLVVEHLFTGNTDGSSPVGLIQGATTDSSANFYVTNMNGGASGDGTIYAASFGVSISGQVNTFSPTAPLSGVTMTLTNGSTSSTALTNAAGNCVFFVPVGSTVTVTPSLAGFAFTPANQTFPSVTLGQTANFTATATATMFTLSGQVTLNGTGLSGVTITLSGTAAATTTTNVTGNYTFTEPAGTYTVTPSLAGYNFTPASPTVSLTSNQTENFTAATGTGTMFTLSGQVTLGGTGLSGVTITLSGAASATTTTNASGNYTFSEPAGTYTLTPSLSGYTFTPASQPVTLSANQTENFTAATGTTTTFTITGQVTVSGTGLAGVTITLTGTVTATAGITASIPLAAPRTTGSTVTATTTTNASGDFTFTEPAGSYTITPSLSGYSFTPASASVPLTGNVTQAFTASPSTTPANLAGSFTHFASGGGQWTTTFTLLNTGASSANITLNFFDSNGNALALPLSFPQGTPNQTTSSFTASLNAGAGLVVQTAGLTNPLVTGSAQLLSNGTVGGFAVFTDNVTATQQQQAVVPMQSLNSSAYLVWFDDTNDFSTAIAVANLSSAAANITVVMRNDAGDQLSTQTITLPASGHTSFDLAASSTWPANTSFTLAENARGTLEFDTPAGGQISVLGLSFNPASAFTSIPAIGK